MFEGVLVVFGLFVDILIDFFVDGKVFMFSRFVFILFIEILLFINVSCDEVVL